MKNENQLMVIVKESGLDKNKANIILEKFQDYFKIAGEWENKIKMLVVTDETQTTEMKMAREGRLFLRNKRIDIENTRKELKEGIIREGKAIEGIANVLKALIIPLEDYLDDQEHFVEIKQAKKAELLRIETEKKVEEARIAEEKRIIAEQEKMRLDNIRLQKEANIREEKMLQERLKAEKIQKDLEEKSRLERQEKEEQLQKERRLANEKLLKQQKEAEEKLKIEKEMAEQEKNKLLEIAKKQKEEADRLAQIERDKLDKILLEQRLEKERIQELLDEQIECPFCHKKFNK